MKIRNRISIQFSLIIASILIIFSLYLYTSFNIYRQNDFYSRLKNRGQSALNLLLSSENVDFDIYRAIQSSTINTPFTIKIFKQSDNTVFYATDSLTTYLDHKNQLDEIISKNEVRWRNGDIESIGFKYKAGSSAYLVISSSYDKYGIEKLLFLRNSLIAGVLISLIIIFFMSRQFANIALKPIGGIISKVEKISALNLNSRLYKRSNNDEIAKLTNTFNNLLNRLEASFKLQQSFISNASHELRTPLTVMRGQIDVALLKRRDTIEYKSILHSIYDDINNLKMLSSGLLDLANADEMLKPEEIAVVKVDELIDHARSDLNKRKPDYSIHIFIHENAMGKDLFMKGSEQLLKSVCINLMDNACKYSTDHKVSVVVDVESDFVKIEFKDHGIGISEEDLKKIFEPFYRSDDARIFKGHGLGLAIVKKIITMHFGTMNVASQLKRGTVVKVLLPLYKYEPEMKMNS